jgi:hypothetical protein
MGDGVVIPDRTPDSRVPEKNVADELALANVIRLECEGRLWCAVIGPDAREGSGLRAFGHTPRQATLDLLIRCETLGWCFDETWREPSWGLGMKG